jgi:hypothetical protein
MAKTIRVEVTAEDIRKGVVGSCDACPVAKALRRTFRTKSATVYYVRSATPRCSVKKLDALPLPLDAAKFAANFDDGKPVSPFSFDLRIPE